MSLLASALLVSTVADAHHSHVNLNPDDIQIYSGVVKEYRWVMPHVYLKIAAPNPQGEVVDYVIELLYPSAQADRGWSPDTFEPGDRVTWEGSTDRSPTRYFTGLNWVEKADGARLTNTREPSDAKVLRSTDFTGMWVRSPVFGSTYFPPANWPLTEAGQSLVDNFDPITNPQLECMEPGPPRGTTLPYPIKITRPDDETIVIAGEVWSEPRVISLDSDRPAGPPSHMGHSVGWFEGDELVVETTNFTARRWGVYVGIDSSDQKQLVERYSLAEDGMVLKVLMTVTDPEYLTAPAIIDYTMNKILDRQFVRAPCSPEGAALFLTGYDQ